MASWREVFEELVRERGAGLVGYAALLTGNVTDGEDLVHDAIIRTFGRVRPFRGCQMVCVRGGAPD